MSRDAGGNYNLPAGNPVITNTIIETAWANPTMADVAAALTDSLSRSGKGGMAAPLDMGGFKIANVGPGATANDVAQATQIRDSAFTLLNPCTSDSTGNAYAGVGQLNVPPVNGTLYLFLADKNNTGPLTLSVNGGSALPILIHGAPVSPGLILTGTVLMVVFQNLTWRLTNTAGVVGTINSVQSDNLNAIGVTNNTVDAVATLNIHANVPNGLVQLGNDSKVPIAYLPFTDLHYIGNWNATPGTNPAAANNGDFYIISGPGNLTLYRNTGANIYTPQVTAVVNGDYIIYNSAGTVNQPTGWYFSAGPGGTVLGSSVTIVPTPTFPGATNVQSWVNQADPVINGKLAKTGGTMTGQILQPAAPSGATALANKQYVDDTFASIPANVSSFNTRSGAVTLISADVTAALGFTPANVGGQVFTGPVEATSFNSAGFYTGKGFNQVPLISGAGGTASPDYVSGQSKIFTLSAGGINFAAFLNVPVGTIMRLVLVNTNFGVTWPAAVHWPLGATPDLTLGPLKTAVVVLENIGGGSFLASSAAY